MIIAGVDETGRGSLAGPVVSAVVAWSPPGFFVKESKSLKPKEREKLYSYILESSIDWSVGIAEADEVDALNIKEATLLSMKRAVDKIKSPINALIVDGCHLINNIWLMQIATPKGDLLNPVVAAASIIAKVTRDRIMTDLSTEFPIYRWNANKGYATNYHLKVIREYGLCKHHRKSFIHEKPDSR
ncbi:MAG: Ribonuclease HII [candidate division WS2 bacterium]|uniref:Ribonuclease n=1 Tax=Psychracetigena formicireducens TaxID=2986056 RepID=A0A9E2BGB6_PSYF1|nr:Ribonuclease HII [Candidatus Psychracetigena formicireducens]MBT9144484.1 Ribonuclease HII [Candidatus Psychracetigena formicireducens]MBT9149978.1 Ribonuclease HII [Candidatus Psychracetigena formicireducens]